MPRYKSPDEGKIGGIDGNLKSSTADKIKQYYEHQTQKQIIEKPKAPESQSAEKPHTDQFRSESAIPKFLQGVQKRLESSWVYQSFKLPGTNYLVRDHRKETSGEGDAVQKESEYEAKDGKLTATKEKSYVNYLGERDMPIAKISTGAMTEVSRLLSEFEKLLIERFEKGKSIEQKSEDGGAHFRAKSEAEWKSFFSKFVSRTVWRNSDLKSLKEFIFRGLVDIKKDGGKYSMLIGDMLLKSGQIEKFARLKILSDVAKMLANAKPGFSVEGELVWRGLSAQELRYLALAHRHGEGSIKTGSEATKGIFSQLKLEKEIAERLGLGKKKRGEAYGGPIKWGEDGEKEEGHGFVPWAFWERENRRGRPVWFAAVIFTIIAFLIFAAIWAIVRYL